VTRSATAGQAAGTALPQEALNEVLFSANNQERLLAQRRLRLALLPKPPDPPPLKITWGGQVRGKPLHLTPYE